MGLKFKTKNEVLTVTTNNASIMKKKERDNFA